MDLQLPELYWPPRLLLCLSREQGEFALSMWTSNLMQNSQAPNGVRSDGGSEVIGCGHIRGTRGTGSARHTIERIVGAADGGREIVSCLSLLACGDQGVANFGSAFDCTFGTVARAFDRTYGELATWAVSA